MATNVDMPIRLALRAEGLWWNAYIARTDTMDGSFRVGSILLSLVDDPTIKQMFMDLMTKIISDACINIFGEEPDSINVRPGPENERSGNV